MKRFSGRLAFGGAIGISLLMAGCQAKEPDVVATLPPPAAPKPKAKTYTEFTIVKQPDEKATPRRGAYDPIVVGVPQSLIVAPDPKATALVSMGTARIVDDAGHSANLGSIDQPGKDETETTFYITRGFSWKWSHPKLELTLTGKAPQLLPLKDLPEPEVVELTGSPAPAGVTCVSVPDLSKAGITASDDRAPLTEPGIVLKGGTAFGGESDGGISCQVVLLDTQSAKGLGFGFRDAAAPAGTKFVPFRFAEATSKIRAAVRKTNSIVEVQDVQFPGCKLVQKFNATGFQVDKDITVKGTNGWSFTLPAQYDGPKREPRKDSRSIGINVIVNPPKADAPAEEEGGGGGGRRGNRALAGLRRRDVDRMKGSPTFELVTPKPEEFGLRNVFVGGHNYVNPKADGPVKYGDFTLHLKVTTTTIKEVSTDNIVIPVTKSK